MTDQELIENFFDGDESALASLIERYMSPVFNFVSYLVPRRNDIDDIVQEVFVKVWKNLSHFDTSKNLKTWIFTIARNTTIDYLRKRDVLTFSRLSNPEEEEYFEDTLTDEAPLAPELFERQENKALVEHILEELSPHQKTAVLLKTFEDMTFEEITEATGRPLNTVKSDYRRGLKVLRKTLEEGPNMHPNKD